MNVPSQVFFNNINHVYRATILKKDSLWLLPFYMVVATYFYYEKVRRTMRTAIVSNLLKGGGGGGLGKKDGGGVFEDGFIPQCTLCTRDFKMLVGWLKVAVHSVFQNILSKDSVARLYLCGSFQKHLKQLFILQSTQLLQLF